MGEVIKMADYRPHVAGVCFCRAPTPDARTRAFVHIATLAILSWREESPKTSSERTNSRE